jgi:preprotein translocase subunit SecG
MFAFLLIVQSVVALALITVILMQRSEGGGLGVGGSSSGFMTARGAADFLTRSTSILGTIFVTLSIVMAAVAGASREPAEIDTTLSNLAVPIEQGNSAAPAQPATNEAQPAPAQNETSNGSMPLVPLAQ